jgi:hypothetical protein
MKTIRFFRRVYADNAQRRDRRRSLATDVRLHLRNVLLWRRNELLVRSHYSEDWPLVFIVGAPRSGTTLLSQLMTRHLCLAWIDNETARYWSAPVEGLRRALVQGAGGRELVSLTSHLGATDGRGGPHEFGWFWQWFGEFPDADELSREELASVKWNDLQRQLYAMSGLARLPLLLKSVTYVNYQIGTLVAVLPRVRFVHIHRDPRFAAQSILEARRARYGDTSHWWSLRPRAWRDWSALAPIEQVCRQVMHAKQSIDAALAGPAHGLGLSISYEQLVVRPGEVLADVSRHLGVPLRNPGELRALTLETQNRSQADSRALALIEQALDALG